ncbi:MAG: SDR family NAD(P)-dependent oxidoreductase [Anaerolineae bacterium]|nr:SDR family NAD(P)-dependent oxidoreductase [Anaerolineae bacterium]
MDATLITGGAGFIGSHVARRMIALERRVVVIDNLNDSYAVQIKRDNIRDFIDHPLVTFIEGDVRDAGLIEQTLAAHNIDSVCHLAAMANVRASIERAQLYFDVNVNGTLNLLEAARKAGVQQFLLASTSSVYGNTSPVPFVETMSADRPLAPYPASKRSAELLAHAIHNLFALPVTVLRFFNVYGPHGRPDMMPIKVLRALMDGSAITVYDDGELKRDWTYIDDIVDGVISALDRPLGYEIINLGFGAPATLNQFIDILEDLTGRRLNIQRVPTPPTELLVTYCDNTKARDLLGFNPAIPLQEGLARTWAWFRGREGSGF